MLLCCSAPSPFQIVIPFFSLLIKDIYFLNEGCANRLPNGHVNFEVGPQAFSDASEEDELLKVPSMNEGGSWRETSEKHTCGVLSLEPCEETLFVSTCS